MVGKVNGVLGPEFWGPSPETMVEVGMLGGWVGDWTILGKTLEILGKSR